MSYSNWIGLPTTGIGRSWTIRLIALAALTFAGWVIPGCVGVEETSPLGQSESTIVGGAAETGYASVGAFVEDGETFCTGTLVSPTVIVTAAHCVEEIRSVRGLSFFFGADTNRPSRGASIPLASVHPHPDYRTNEDADIAVVILESASSVTPMALPSTNMSAAWKGRDLLFIGYGITSATTDAAGEKRSVEIPITDVNPLTFRYSGRGVNTCNGDSGGPALAQQAGKNELVGVTSWGDEDCREFGVNTRVDPYLAWIRSFMNGTPPPTSTPPPGDDSGSDPDDGDWGDDGGDGDSGW